MKPVAPAGPEPSRSVASRLGRVRVRARARVRVRVRGSG